MRRLQTTLGFWTLLSLSMFVAAVRADESGSTDLSLIGYDDRGVQQSQNGAQAQPCQSCPPGTACQAGSSDAACQCKTPEQKYSTAAAPMILNIGPPPRLYSPSADFGTRVGTEAASWSIVGDERSAPPLPSAQTGSAISMPCMIVSAPQPVYSTPGTSPTAWHQAPPCALNDSTTPVMSELSAEYSLPLSVSAPPMCVPAVMYPSLSPVPMSLFKSKYGQLTTDCQCTLMGQCASNCQCAATNQCGTMGDCAAIDHGDRLDHMLQAMHHLEAAGLQGEADRLRGECDSQMQEVVSQLKTAEAEIDRLRRTAWGKVTSDQPVAADNASQKQIIIHVQLFEINRCKCATLGFDFDTVTNAISCGCSGPHDLEPSLHVVSDHSQLLEFLETLKKEGVAEVITSPTITTKSGQSARIEIGRQYQVPVSDCGETQSTAWKTYGTKLEVHPTITAEGKVQLQMRPQFSQIDPSHTVLHDAGECPAVSIRDAEFTVEMKSGQTAVVQAVSGQPASEHSAVVVRTEIAAGSESTSLATNRPQSPVVIAAVPARDKSEHFYPVQQASYIVPAESVSRTSQSFDDRPLPAPFLPQPITIEPMNLFAKPEQDWINKSVPGPFETAPAILPFRFDPLPEIDPDQQ